MSAVSSVPAVQHDFAVAEAPPVVEIHRARLPRALRTVTPKRITAITSVSFAAIHSTVEVGDLERSRRSPGRRPATSALVRAAVPRRGVPSASALPVDVVGQQTEDRVDVAGAERLVDRAARTRCLRCPWGPPRPEVFGIMAHSSRVLRVDGSVDEIAVDVQRHAAPRLVVVAAVLVDTTVLRPERRRQHGGVVAEQVGSSCPPGDPDRVDGGEGGIRYAAPARRAALGVV